MEIKNEKKVITQNVEIYVARDGREFTNAYNCKMYEKELDKKAQFE